jgi:3',5'-cyclic AMP phosphodiesterase CpdA
MNSHSPESRRKFIAEISMLCLGGLGAGCSPVSTRLSVRKQPAFRFIVVNDLHHAGPECTPFFAGLIEQMRRHEDVAFCLAVGDIVDTGSPEGLAAMRDIFAALGVPVYPVPGNHDCDLEKNTRLYASVFSDRVNYTFQYAGWQFIGFDSTDGNAWHDTRIGAAALAFLESAARQLDPAAPTIVFTHFPLAADVHMAPLNTAEALARLDTLNVRAAFCGHFHGRTERQHAHATLITNACCSRVRNNHDGTREEGYLLCTAHPDGELATEFIPYAPARPNVAPKAIT